ncbi:lamin tail domain-containing protein [Halosegnis sp.]|uniref:lamin tail domain-containing protein n=1 Tax=Halosegnis sp. TaxID=2864959 RepID=UPI0035D50E09
MSPPRSRFAVGCCLVLVILAGCAGGTTGGSTNDTPAATASTATDTAVSAEGTLETHFINVGQSVSTLIIGPTGETMLIDTGHFTDDGKYVLQYLQRHNIDRIDYLVTTHNDADHIGGNAAVIDYYETEANGIGAVYDPGIAAGTETYSEYLDAIEQHDVTLYETREGDTIAFEGVAVQVLGPPEPYIENEARNENSIVLKLGFGQTSFLFTGDAEDDQEAYLVEEYGTQLDATLMKAGHHGSDSSTSGALLDAAQPKAVVISSAYDSHYGHPNEAVLNRLAQRDIPTYWTATHGDTVLVSDGETVTIKTQAAAPTNPSRLREGSPVDPGTTTAVSPRVTLTGNGVTDATATATPTTVADGGTATPTALAVATVHADAEGDDRDNLNDEYVTFENTGDAPLELGGWTVTDAAGATYTFPDGFTLGGGAQVTLHTGSGDNTDTALYWDRGSPVWNNDGDTVTVTTAEGQQVLEVSYS